MALIAVVEPITNIAVQALAEFCWGQRLECAHIESLKGREAGKVDAMSQVDFEFFNFALKVNLVQEEPCHFLSYLLLLWLLGESLAT